MSEGLRNEKEKMAEGCDFYVESGKGLLGSFFRDVALFKNPPQPILFNLLANL
jgi:hypothetical protein